MTNDRTYSQQPAKRTRNSAPGFTVVEFVIAASILFGVVVAVMSVVTFSAAAAQSNAVRDSAVNLANQHIEQARNLPYDDIGVYYTNGAHGDPPGSILTPQTVNDFEVSTAVWWERDETSGRATYKNINVTVSWVAPREGSVTVSSAIYGRSLLNNTGDVLVTVLDIDTVEPIDGASVILSPASGSARSLRSDAAGEAFFGFVSSGPLDLELESGDYIFDLSSIAGAEVAPDALTRLTVFGQLPSSALIHVIGSGGDNIRGAEVTISDATGTELTETTDSRGIAEFDGLLRGEWVVTATAANRSDVTDAFTISTGGESVEVELVMPDPAALLVHVLADGSGAPIPDAEVTVTGPQPRTDQAPGSPAVSNSNGEASFQIAGSGSYFVRVSAPGFTDGSATVIVSAGSSSVVEVSLNAPQSGALLIRVEDSRGRPIARAKLVVWNADFSYIQSGIRCEDGEIVLPDLVPGVYYARVVQGGATGTAEVTNGTTALMLVVSR